MNTSNSTDGEAMTQTLVKLMAIADRLDARNLQTVQQLEAAVVTLDQGASRLSEGGDAFAQRALGMIGTAARQSIIQGTDKAVQEVRQRLEHTAKTAQAAAQSLEREAGLLASARRTLVWNGLMALLLASFLLSSQTYRQHLDA